MKARSERGRDHLHFFSTAGAASVSYPGPKQQQILVIFLKYTSKTLDRRDSDMHINQNMFSFQILTKCISEGFSLFIKQLGFVYIYVEYTFPYQS